MRSTFARLCAALVLLGLLAGSGWAQFSNPNPFPNPNPNPNPNPGPATQEVKKVAQLIRVEHNRALLSEQGQLHLLSIFSQINGAHGGLPDVSLYPFPEVQSVLVIAPSSTQIEQIEQLIHLLDRTTDVPRSAVVDLYLVRIPKAADVKKLPAAKTEGLWAGQGDSQFLASLEDVNTLVAKGDAELVASERITVTVDKAVDVEFEDAIAQNPSPELVNLTLYPGGEFSVDQIALRLGYPANVAFRMGGCPILNLNANYPTIITRPLPAPKGKPANLYLILQAYPIPEPIETPAPPATAPPNPKGPGIMPVL